MSSAMLIRCREVLESCRTHAQARVAWNYALRAQKVGVLTVFELSLLAVYCRAKLKRVGSKAYTMN